MRVVITGGCGFLGQCLAHSILRQATLSSNFAENGEAAVSEVYLADITQPPSFLFPDLHSDNRVQVKLGDVSSRSFVDSLLVGESDISIFHMSAVMSGQGEEDFDLCMRVNLHGMLNILEAARALSSRPRIVFTSTAATFGSGAQTDYLKLGDPVRDSTRATPHTTYGSTKACSELLLSDYSRRGFIDGRGVRLPTIVVRAGAPNAATTSCFSSIIREPLAGKASVMPISKDVKHAVAGYRMVVDAMIKMHNASTQKVEEVLGFDRTVFLPACVLSLQDLLTALYRVVEQPHTLGQVTFEPNSFLSEVVGSFPTKIDSNRSAAFGIQPDQTPEDLIRQYAADFPSAVSVSLKPVTPPPATEEKEVETRKVILVTGAGSGIGRAVITAMAKEYGRSAVLLLVGRRNQLLEEVAAAAEQHGGTAVPIPCDVAEPEEVQALFDRISAHYGRLDVLFNNAGVGLPPTPTEHLSVADWKKVVDINLTGVFLCTSNAIRIMKAQQPQGGRIINNGSISSQVPRPHSAAYTATKHAVAGLTKSTALDGRKFNIACGQIDIGNVQSDMTRSMAVGMPQADGSVRTEPTFDVDDVARAVLYMASLPLGANVLNMTVMASGMPFVGRG